MDPAALAALTREALHQAKRRAVVAMGWGGMRDFEESDRLLVVEDVPHDWLFPRVSAVVHHAGAGTTAAALRAGKPSVGVPFFGDQPWWARALARHGVAPPPIAKKKLTAERLAAAIVAATTNDAFRSRAEEMGAQIRAERGAALSADRALHYLDAG
jgi:sterol 3beta-glucosyltransferase